MSKFLYVAIAALLFGCASGVETTIPLPTLTCFPPIVKPLGLDAGGQVTGGPAIVDCHDGADCSQGQVCYPTDIDGGRSQIHSSLRSYARDLPHAPSPTATVAPNPFPPPKTDAGYEANECPCSGYPSRCDLLNKDTPQYFDCYAGYYQCIAQNDALCGALFTAPIWQCLANEGACLGSCISPAGEDQACTADCRAVVNCCISDAQGVCDFNCGTPYTTDWYRCEEAAENCQGVNQLNAPALRVQACISFCAAASYACDVDCSAGNDTPSCLGGCAAQNQECAAACVGDQ